MEGKERNERASSPERGLKDSRAGDRGLGLPDCELGPCDNPSSTDGRKERGKRGQRGERRSRRGGGTRPERMGKE